jgi:enoyl-CoA hydratase/carnithine racemase
MAKFEYELDKHMAVVTMNSGENRFNFSFFEAFSEILDKVENDTDAGVLVVKSSHEKIWSNGIDPDWLGPAIAEEGPELRDRPDVRLVRARGRDAPDRLRYRGNKGGDERFSREAQARLQQVSEVGL